ncbi:MULTISPECIES: ECF transporter S component [unclassified Isoptericola]|uniref:ECF transporter S component n=1 Tax=unclassified Isoptericola TaxID=2623355 RepID=UPI0036524758
MSAPIMRPTVLGTARASLRYRTVDLVTMAMLGVAVGVVFWGWTQLYHLLSAGLVVAFPPATGLLGGGWLLGGVLGGLIVRKPGAALLTEVVAASVEALLGAGWGFSAIVSGVVQGLGVELVLALFLYRRFGTAVAALSGAAAGACGAVYEWFAYYPDWQWGFRLAYLGFFALSGALLAGLGGAALVRALARTGVLDAFAPGRDLADGAAGAARVARG